MNPRKLYSKPDAAEQLSVSTKTLERLIRDGQIDSVKIGRSRLIPEVALDEYVERLRRSA